MRNLFSSVALAIFFAVGANADYAVPDQKILGVDKTWAFGKLVRLSVSPLGEKPDHYVSSSYTWRVFDGRAQEEYETKDNNTVIFFGSGTEKKSLHVILVIVHLYAEKGGDGDTKVATREVVLDSWVEISGNPPPPRPPADQLSRDLRSALEKEVDPNTKELFGYLASLYRQSADLANDASVTTWGGLFEVMEKAAKRLGIAGKLVHVQTVIQTELQKSFPWKGASDRPIDRKLAFDTLSRIGDALEALK